MEELGRSLKEAREDKGISLDHIAQTTKIHRRYLEMIEAGAFDQLPGPVYTRAFLRHYARAVGIDPEYVIDQYRQRQPLQGSGGKEGAPEQGLSVSRYREIRRQRKVRRAKQARWTLAIVVLLAVVIAGVYVAGEQRRMSGQNPIENGERPDTGENASTELILETAKPLEVGNERDKTTKADEAAETIGKLELEDEPDTVEPPGLDAAEEKAEAIEAPSTAEPSDEGPSQQMGDTVDLDEAAKEDPQFQGSQDAIGDPDAAHSDETLAEPAEEGEGEAGAALSEAIPGVVLLVDVDETCWFDVIADGRRIFTGILQPGTQATWVADELLQVKFGRPEGVFLTLNGEPLGRAGTGVITREFRKDGTD